jgi:uncharacterized protein (TIGR02271 family)
MATRSGRSTRSISTATAASPSGWPKTGLLGSNVSFVPIRDAELASDDVRVAHGKEKVKDAPNVDPDGELSPEEERRLYEYYGRSDYDEWTDASEDRTEAPVGPDARDRVDRDELAARRDADRGGPRGEDDDAVERDVSGPATDDAMTRSEEEVRVGTERRETGRARLRKYVVTENVQETVPVKHEEARVEREPITDDNIEQAMSGPDITGSEHEVTLHTEEPVVEKRTVHKERVRLDKDVHTDERTVNEEVRHERIEGDGQAEARV